MGGKRPRWIPGGVYAIGGGGLARERYFGEGEVNRVRGGRYTFPILIHALVDDLFVEFAFLRGVEGGGGNGTGEGGVVR